MYQQNDALIISESHKEADQYYKKAESIWGIFSCIKRANLSKAQDKYKESIIELIN